MLQEFWSYFMETGNIEMYLDYKEYENEYNNQKGKEELPGNTHEVG